MASQQEVNTKRENVKKLRAELRTAKTKQSAGAGERNRQSKLDGLTAEEASLEAELASLRGAAPAPAAAPPAAHSCRSTR